MIDLSTSQLTWLIVGACSMGGTGYLTISTKVDGLDKNIAIIANNADHTNRNLEEIKMQLNKIQEKLESIPAKR